MKDKALKRLHRADLIEIVYQLQQEREALIKENENLKEQLQNRNLKIENAGSLAEAVANITGIFEHAQTTADVYLQNIADLREMEVQHFEEAKQMVCKAKKLMAKAQEKAGGTKIE